MSNKLTTDERDEMKNAEFGIPSKRAFPLNDESHVRAAVRMFPFADDSDKRELARNILKRAKHFNIDTSKWESLKPYMEMVDDKTSGSSDFDNDDVDNEPDDCYVESIKQEAYDAITGKEIPINHAYTMEEMKEITFSESELKHIKYDDELISVKRPNEEEVYFGSPTNHMPEIDLDGPLFVTPLKGIASIFIGRDVVRDHIPKGSYNLGYKEFSYPNNRLKDPLKEVHVYVEGYPSLEPFSFEDEGYIHCIKTKDYADNFYRYEWMAKGGAEFLIANTDNIKVEFTRVIKCKVRYIVEGKPGKPGSGPDPNGLLSWAKDIANKIHAKYESDKKEPTGNQNCQLCTWCAEAQFRDHDILPRPIYSPRDPAFDIEGETIVKNSTRLKPTSFDNLLELLSVETPFGRWYCHVKWSEGNGGHEFLILKIHNKYFTMDPQQGSIEPLHDTNKYVEDIDWDETFICRFDDKEFDYTLLEKINDPSKTVQWDESKDIPYMRDHDMLPDEEAEVYNELFYRFEYEGIGIYEALHRNMSISEWKLFKQSKAATWLPIPPNYQSGDESFFTKKGYNKFMKLTYPYIIKYLDESKVRKFECELNPKYIRYKDEYQVVFNKTLPIQESFQDVKNGINPFNKNLVFHISKEGHLDGRVFKPRVPEYLDKYDPTQPNFEDVESPRTCFSPSIEGCLNAILVNIGRWKTADKLGDWYVYIPEKPLKEYQHKTTKELIKEKKVYDANITDEVWITEPVRLKQYGIIHVDQVNNVVKKKTVPMLNGKSGERNKYNIKWHWLVKPKVLKNVPYIYTAKSVCEDMLMDMSEFKYGLPYGGKIISGSSEDFDKKYKLQSPDEFEKTGGGICYDFVEWQERYLDWYGHTCTKYFISTDTKDNDTHTFMLIEDGNGGFVYPEVAFGIMKGVHLVKSLEEALQLITKNMFKINGNDKKYSEIKYYVWKYVGHPKYGSNMVECHKFFTRGEPIYEGVAKYEKHAPIQEFVTEFRKQQRYIGGIYNG